MTPQQAHDTVASDQHPQRQFRINRGALAIGTDGTLGTIEQIVVDSVSAELQALIIRTSRTGELIELPASHILHDRVDGESVYLDVGNADLASHPALARPYRRGQYVPVRQEEAAQRFSAEPASQVMEHPIVTSVESDAAQLVLPTKTHIEAPPASETAETTDRAGENVKDMGNMGDTNEDAEEEQTPTLPMRTIPRPPEELLTTSEPVESAESAEPLEEPVANDDTLGATSHDEEEEEQEMRNEQETRADDANTMPASAQLEADQVQATSPIDEVQTAQERLSTYETGERAASSTDQTTEAVPASLIATLAAAGAGIGALGGAIALVVQRRRARRLDVRDMQGIADQARDTLASVGQNAGQLAESARQTLTQTRKRARRAARRTTRRVRWFRNGLIAGAILAILFAPMPGEQLRARIKQTSERLRRKLPD
jgi:ElaB/YqjD/DUF883 family membrane-anchored ribosome-binding protein